MFTAAGKPPQVRGSANLWRSISLPSDTEICGCEWYIGKGLVPWPWATMSYWGKQRTFALSTQSGMNERTTSPPLTKSTSCTLFTWHDFQSHGQRRQLPPFWTSTELVLDHLLTRSPAVILPSPGAVVFSPRGVELPTAIWLRPTSSEGASHGLGPNESEGHLPARVRMMPFHTATRLS